MKTETIFPKMRSSSSVFPMINRPYVWYLIPLTMTQLALKVREIHDEVEVKCNIHIHDLFMHHSHGFEYIHQVYANTKFWVNFDLNTDELGSVDDVF